MPGLTSSLVISIEFTGNVRSWLWLCAGVSSCEMQVMSSLFLKSVGASFQRNSAAAFWDRFLFLQGAKGVKDMELLEQRVL